MEELFLRCEIEVVPCQAPYCVLRVARLTDTACQLADRIRCLDMKKELPALHAWDGNFCVPLELSEIVRVFAMDKTIQKKINPAPDWSVIRCGFN